MPSYNNPQSLNRYTYVYNAPLNYIDPSGHDADYFCSGSDDYSSSCTGYVQSQATLGSNMGGGNGGGGGGGGGRDDDEPGGAPPPPTLGTETTCGQQGVYSSNCPGWHNYTTTNLVCPANLECTAADMMYYLSLFAYPGQNPLDGPITSGGFYNVSDPWFRTLPRSIGPIVSYIDGLSVSNVTRPGHILHDGRIDRTAFQGPNGAWYVRTHGYGNNETHLVEFDPQRPDLSPLTMPVDFSMVNEWGGKAIFNQVDQQMLEYIIADR